MTRLLIATFAAGLAIAVPAMAAADGPRDRIDRVEDRIDRIESRIDRRTDIGPRDRIEDVIDRREDIADRRGYAGSRKVDRHERRSWWRLRPGH